MNGRETGKHGEWIAVDYLRHSGAIIMDTNYYTRFGEIDIVAKRGSVIHFVEVKTRLNRKYGSATCGLTRLKIRRFVKTVQVYLNSQNLENVDCSLDLMAIDIEEDGVIDVQWLQNITV